MGTEVTAVARRTLSRVRHDGAWATLAQAWNLASKRVHLREKHVWYELGVSAERPRRELPPGVQLERGGLDQAHRVEELDQNPDATRERLGAGNTLWLAFDGDDLLFGCWTFSERTPVLAAPGGWLHLPGGIACLEDSATTPVARGRGIAPGSWTAIADQLAGEGCTAMITKVEVANTASRKAVVKSGFREIGVMSYTRLGPRTRTSMQTAGDGLGAELAKRLGATT